MKVYNSESKLIAEGYFVPNPNFIPKGEYKETELDVQKRKVDFLIVGVGNRYEIRFNKPIKLKESRSIKRMTCGNYLVTEKALESLKMKYSHLTDF